jgi:Flp pilus assembly protein TadG
MRSVSDRFKMILDCRKGNFATTLAVLAPIFGGLIAGGVDFIAFNNQKSELQSAADGAALAAVNEAALKGWNHTVASSVAGSYMAANMRGAMNTDKYYKIDASVDVANREITVSVQQDHYPFFFASMFPSPQIDVSATATAAGSTNICVIGLDPNRSGTVGLNDSAVLSAPECAVYSNSAATDGIAAIKWSRMTAELACSAGGYKGAASRYGSSPPLTDCPAIEDPLSSRPAPFVSNYCDGDGLVLKSKKGSTTLSPGVYCNGLTIKSKANVTLEPGIYVIKDGPLTLSANASMVGDGVGFYFTGDDARFSLESGSIVDLKAAKSGKLAGLLFYQEHGSAEENFVLRSNKASMLLGTIYLPNGNFIIDTNSKVADESAYTAIVARTLTLKRKPNVVLNTNYDATDVPVPDGVGPQDGAPRLLR